MDRYTNNKNRPVSFNSSMPSSYVSRNGQRAASSGNWREKASDQQSDPQADMFEQLQAFQMAQLQAQQQQYMTKQQELYQYQQNQMAMQLEAMKLQNLELQERLLASMQVQPPQTFDAPSNASSGNRRSALLSGLRMPSNGSDHSLPDSPTSNASDAGDVSSQRRGALQNLQRAQQNRRSGEFSPPQVTDAPLATETHQRAGNNRSRLSFNGGDALAERAMARKNANNATTPPLTQMHFDFYSSPEGMDRRFQHHRQTSSMSSTASEVLSESRKRIVSPSGGPTLVLSSPGEAFPSPTLGRTSRATRLTVRTQKEEEDLGHIKESSSSSSGSNTPSSETSEVLSFESNTSVSTQASKPTKEVTRGSSVPALNPSAPSFTPGHFAKASIDGSATPPTNAANRHGRTSSLTTFTPPSSFSSVMQGHSGSPHVSGLYRTFSPPSGSPAAVTIIRQPKGPAQEEDLPTKNFAIRKRRREFSSIKTRLRGSGTSPCSSPTVQTKFF